MTANRMLISPEGVSRERSTTTVDGGFARSDAYQRLIACSFFCSLDEGARRRVALRARRRRFAAGEVIFHMGSDGQSMMAILAGTVRLTLPSAQGKQIVLADLPPGEIFGEVALLDGCGRSADATALTNCELALLDRRDLLLLLEQHPHACLKLLEVICGRLRRSDERMMDVLFSASPVRLAKVLLSRAGRMDGRADDTIGGRIALSQRELGSMAGVRRERVNRCLQEWQRQGIVGLKKGWIVILDVARLREIAEPG